MGGCLNCAILKQQTTDTGPSLISSTWVKNLSDTLLTEAQEGMLAHGQCFMIIPRCPPKGEYIVAIEHACLKLNHGEAEELRVKVKKILQKTQMPKSNITKEEFQAIKELKKNDNRMILTADKGVAMMVLNKEDYIKKAEDLLSQKNIQKDSRTFYTQTEDQTYKPAKKTSKQKGAKMMKHTKECTPQEQDIQSSMGCQKYTSQDYPWGL